MTPEDIQQSVDYIRAVQDHPEEAHNAEDHLYVSVLSAIAEGLLDDQRNALAWRCRLATYGSRAGALSIANMCALSYNRQASR